MVETRSNPNTGLMEVKHPTLNFWVQAIAALGEVTVALTSAQAEAINQIEANTGLINQLIAAVSDLQADLSGSYAELADIAAVRIPGINSDITELISANNSVETEIGTLRTLVQDVITYVDLVETNQGTQSAHLGNAVTKLDSVITLLTNRTPTGCEITQLTLTSANIGYSYTVPAGTKRLAFKCRGDVAKSDPTADIRYAWVVDKVAPNGGGQGVDSYDILPNGAEESADQVFSANTPIYFASATAGVIVSIRRWF